MFARSEKAYILCCTLFCTLLALTNLIGTKLFVAPFSTLALSSSIVIYPLTFLLNDIVCEVFGKRKSKFMVLLGFITNLMMLIYVVAITQLAPHPSWATTTDYGYATAKAWQDAFSRVFALNPIVVTSSLFAYMIAQFTDIAIFHRLKKATNGKHLWLRNNLSTILSQLIDTFIVTFIVLYLAMQLPGLTVLQVAIMMYFFKALIALLDTPFCYLSIFLIKKWINSPKKSTNLLNPEPEANP